jgi:hypothetical protein
MIMNEGQIYRANCIIEAIEDIEMIVSKLGLTKEKYDVIMKNTEIIKHNAIRLSFRDDEWDRPE